jgi:hypothetical protein
MDKKLEAWTQASNIIIYTLNSILICFELVILWRGLFIGKRQKFLIILTLMVIISSVSQITYSSITYKNDREWVRHPVSIVAFIISFITFLGIQWAFVGRYWKVALLMPYVIKPDFNMRKPRVGWPLTIFWVSVIVI